MVSDLIILCHFICFCFRKSATTDVQVGDLHLLFFSDQLNQTDCEMLFIFRLPFCISTLICIKTFSFSPGGFGERLSVAEGDSVTLQTDATEIHEDEDILWYFGDKKSLIAKFNRETKTDDGLDERFRDRLKLDHQTGSLTITNTTTQHAGLYQLEISGAKLKSKTFSVSVYGEKRSFALSFAYSCFILMQLT